MIKRFTHKEFVLLLGVAVALLVAFILWFNQQPLAQSTQLENVNTIPHVLAPLKVNDSFWKKSVLEVSALLFQK